MLTHKYSRHFFIHEMVQPFLDTRANPETKNILSTPGWPADIDVLYLRGQHFPISMYPKWKTCIACGYKTDENGKQSRKKTSNYCEKCDLHVCKDCFEKFDTCSTCLMLKKKKIEFVGKFYYVVQSHECYYKDYCKNVWLNMF